MRRFEARILLVALLVVLSGARGASAECVGQRLCESVAGATAVFVAEVERVYAWRGLQHVEFRNVDVLKGGRRLRSTMAFEPLPESHPFRPRERVLIFAHRVDEEAWSTQCTRTRVLGPAGLAASERTLIRRYARALPVHESSEDPARARRGKTCRELDPDSER